MKRFRNNSISMLLAFFIPSAFALEDFGASQYYLTEGASIIGGGEGYSDYCISNKPVVNNLEEFINTISSAVAGDVIYIDDDAIIDLTGRATINIPKNITICSGRGREGSLGGKITKAHSGSHDVMFNAVGEGITITGLRLDGQDPEIRGDLESTYDEPLISGIYICDNQITAQNPVVVSNNEITGFSYYGVATERGYNNGLGELSVIIKNNYIHHNRRKGLGYGVMVDGDSSVLVEANYFDFNRHDIAGTGDPGQTYEARYNLVGSGGSSHNFDMHRQNGGDGYTNGGDLIRIHHNSFSLTSYPNVVIRGVPDTGASISYNSFPKISSESAVQYYGSGRFDVSNNLENTREWMISESASKDWRMINTSRIGKENLRYGDFVGDEKIDVFTSFQGQWYVSDAGIKPWQPLAQSEYAITDLRFADLIGDEKTDVFLVKNGQWFVSESGVKTWVSIASSNYSLDDLVFANVIGDAKDDVIYMSGSEWFASDGGQSAWIFLGKSTVRPNDILVTDIIGASNDDFFIATGYEWFASEGTPNWQSLTTSQSLVGQLNVGDVVGDEKGDILISENGKWLVSESGVGSWQPIGSSTYDISGLVVRDFIGDAKDDVLRIK
ncbi:right-handed parallel beta-helix repeat-containing protein [Microbulbifer sp. GL-2]|uniref:right-handed parallel beta-helix repeat-containing protein n=1 Tax=Microbulbifer sp. GL-2 TaxID=2591606 RepID=UPI001164845A|nr:right-handed parallel beta-helix repeat-containing protein [Microbulbifer sp. GL-2]BBM03773.1 hypothetical protein GL2_38470 [Microbulbifer sp. GL-2]